jgi:hypothetical protein
MKINYQQLLREKKYQALGITVLLIVFLTLCITSLFFPLQESLTYDEEYHHESAKAILRGEASRRGDQDPGLRNIMPMSALNILAARAIKILLPIAQSLPINDIFLEKLATIIVAIILAIYVFIWSRKLYGISAAFLALTLYVLDPNIIAHSRLFTQDIFGTFTIFVAVYYFWSLLRFGGRTNLILSIFTFSLAQISRFTSIHLVPIFVLLSVSFYGSSILTAFKEKNSLVIRQGLKCTASYIVLLVLSTILILNIGFSFERTLTKFGDYQFISYSFKNLQTNPILKQVPVPVPYAYLQGLDFGKYKQETGFGSAIPYLFGHLSFESDPVKGFQLKGIKEYFLVAFLYKVPIATQILIGLAIVSLLIDQKHLDLWKNEAFLLIPCGFYMTFMSFSTTQIGIRYVLMIFPFLFVFASRVVMGWNARKLRYRLLIIGLAIYLALSNLSYFPHYISYFNELVTNRKMSYKILVDSNLDWGQNKNYLQQYLLNHPTAMFVRYDGDGTLRLMMGNRTVEPNPVSIGNSINLLVIEANQLVGITTDSNRFYWLRSSREPIDNVAYSYLVFKVEAKDAKDILKKP